MIIRIMGQGQFIVPSGIFDDLNTIDNRIVEHVAKGNEVELKKDLSNLISMIKHSGKPVRDEDIMESDIIVPPEDLTLEEAKDVFSGQGIFED